MEKRRRTIIAGTVIALALLAARHPTADIELMFHDLRDPSPRQIRTAVDTGLMGISLLVTWTDHVAR